MFQCPDVWDAYPRVCYLFTEDSKNLSDSKAACEALGATLAIIRNATDQANMETTMRNSGSNASIVWVDGQRANVTSPFTFADGTIITNTYDTNWASDQPDGDCCINLDGPGSSSLGVWYVEPTDFLSSYLCQLFW